jgi:hypothetical protein
MVSDVLMAFAYIAAFLLNKFVMKRVMTMSCMGPFNEGFAFLICQLLLSFFSFPHPTRRNRDALRLF